MIFIDSGAFLARYVTRDQHHVNSVQGWKTLNRLGLRCFTSNFVVDECLTLLARRTSNSFAAARGRAIYASAVLEILRPGEDEETRALGLLEKYGDQKVSFTDCVSFTLMRANRIRRAFSFDRHFELAGFELWPSEK